ncbi:ArsI/CadI family heavy metal resistance metalloenzyme [Burkholderia thailandensis]|uniref:ArsI/CadI family heavy metal resistance metalloenzyme n=1 Tax=Burkholderia thailandensis TaxID=57975 RepID=UPI00016A7998|nr:ArsI/CadI family heavy metal resistance metalloenzyme [Burkholderia thailandensis]
MKRYHVHVSVANLADSIRFYSALFAVEPTVVKDDYAKWMLDDPRINFAISQRGAAPGLDHLGMQAEDDAELAEMRARLDHAALPIDEQIGTACCYARSDKYWTVDPQGIAWEAYRTLGEVPTFGESRAVQAPEANGGTRARRVSSCGQPASAPAKSSCC